jgi:hyperosmotically inducible periplasmic protein
MKSTWKGIPAGLVAVVLFFPLFLQAAARPRTLEEQVRHELIMLPHYNVFDSLSFQVTGDKVTLTGEVTWPTLRSDAANMVKGVPGVKSVDNQIEVLPLSPFDDRIRWAELRAIYGNSALFRYNLMGPVAPIRIVVKNGRVTLEGVVANQMDKQIAGLAANGVFGVFAVTNNLQVRTS